MWFLRFTSIQFHISSNGANYLVDPILVSTILYVMKLKHLTARTTQVMQSRGVQPADQNVWPAERILNEAHDVKLGDLGW